jgi:excisionase family DNA binding protein
LLTIAQAAALLAVSEGTIRNLISRGDLAACRVVDDSPRIWLDDLKQYARQRTRRAYGSGKDQ